jgi:hypothetical protein
MESPWRVRPRQRALWRVALRRRHLRSRRHVLRADGEPLDAGTCGLVRTFRNPHGEDDGACATVRERRRRRSGLASPDGGSFDECDDNASVTVRVRRGGRGGAGVGARARAERGARKRGILVMGGSVIGAGSERGRTGTLRG